MSVQVARALIEEHLWLLALLVLIIWFVKATARTAAGIIRVAAWDWLLRLKGVSKSKRRTLIADAAQRDLESL